MHVDPSWRGMRALRRLDADLLHYHPRLAGLAAELDRHCFEIPPFLKNTASVPACKTSFANGRLTWRPTRLRQTALLFSRWLQNSPGDAGHGPGRGSRVSLLHAGIPSQMTALF